jgi:hypothetical protein
MKEDPICCRAWMTAISKDDERLQRATKPLTFHWLMSKDGPLQTAMKSSEDHVRSAGGVGRVSFVGGARSARKREKRESGKAHLVHPLIASFLLFELELVQCSHVVDVL